VTSGTSGSFSFLGLAVFYFSSTRPAATRLYCLAEDRIAIFLSWPIILGAMPGVVEVAYANSFFNCYPMGDLLRLSMGVLLDEDAAEPTCIR
jgi:hypothetical protein